MACGRGDIDTFLNELSWSDLQELRKAQSEKQLRERKMFAGMFAVLSCKFGVDSATEDFLLDDDLENDEPEQEMTPEQQFAAMTMAIGARQQ